MTLVEVEKSREAELFDLHTVYESLKCIADEIRDTCCTPNETK